jgi:surfeit locus 1 family protein
MGERPRRLVVALAALLSILLTARLGVWQLDRATQKEAMQALLLAQAALPSLASSQLAKDAAGAHQQVARRVRLTGQWLPTRSVYLDNRQMKGQPGFFVLTPLQLSSGEAVLVQRGWLPRDQLDRTRLAPHTTPAGPVSLEGRIAMTPSRQFALGADAGGPIRQNLDLASYAAEIGLPLRPFTVLELPSADNQADGLLRDWQAPTVDVQKHHGYAAQWFALCGLLAGLYVWFQVIRPWRTRRG